MWPNHKLLAMPLYDTNTDISGYKLWPPNLKNIPTPLNVYNIIERNNNFLFNVNEKTL